MQFQFNSTSFVFFSLSIPLTPFCDIEESGSHTAWRVYLFDEPRLWPISKFLSPLFHTEASLFLFWSNSSQWPPHFPRVNASTTCWSPVCHCPPHLAWVVTPYFLLGHPPMQLLSLFCSRSDTSGHSPMKYYPSPPAWVLTSVTPTTACVDTPLQAHSPPSTL